MIYLGGPYTDDNEAVREARYNALTRIAYLLIAAGIPVYSPITHNHPLAKLGKITVGWEFWKKFDRIHLRNCSMLVILKLDGWDKSTGVKGEVEIATELGIPISYITEEELEKIIEVYKIFCAPIIEQMNKEKVQA